MNDKKIMTKQISKIGNITRDAFDSFAKACDGAAFAIRDFNKAVESFKNVKTPRINSKQNARKRQAAKMARR